jgi:Zn-dependent peptidase ImmA (M78 family)/DNA-binding XRE family transcriptional regulator
MTATIVLDNTNPQELGELLRQARQKCGMKQSDVAKAIYVARTTIVAIEKGERPVKAAELNQLACLYGRSVNEFVCDHPVVQPFEIHFQVAYRCNEGEEVQIKSSVLRLEDLCRNYLELEEIVSASLPQNYPSEQDVTNLPIKVAAESIAISERQQLGLGDSPVSRLHEILAQDVGLRIFYLDLPPKYSGIYTYDERLGGCMAINVNHSEERQRWSIARQYFRFLTDRRKAVLDFEGKYQRTPESERSVESFAKYFLIPTSGLLKRFNDMCRAHGKFTPTHLFTLAHYYGVSAKVLACQLEEMELVRTGTWEKLRDRGLKLKKVQQEFSAKTVPRRTETFPLHYQCLAIEALDRGLITETRFCDYLNVDRPEACRIAALLREHSTKIMEV